MNNINLQNTKENRYNLNDNQSRKVPIRPDLTPTRNISLSAKKESSIGVRPLSSKYEPSKNKTPGSIINSNSKKDLLIINPNTPNNLNNPVLIQNQRYNLNPNQNYLNINNQVNNQVSKLNSNPSAKSIVKIVTSNQNTINNSASKPTRASSARPLARVIPINGTPSKPTYSNNSNLNSINIDKATPSKVISTHNYNNNMNININVNNINILSNNNASNVKTPSYEYKSPYKSPSTTNIRPSSASGRAVGVINNANVKKLNDFDPKILMQPVKIMDNKRIMSANPNNIVSGSNVNQNNFLRGVTKPVAGEGMLKILQNKPKMINLYRK